MSLFGDEFPVGVGLPGRVRFGGGHVRRPNRNLADICGKHHADSGGGRRIVSATASKIGFGEFHPDRAAHPNRFASGMKYITTRSVVALF